MPLNAGCIEMPLVELGAIPENCAPLAGGEVDLITA